MSAFWEIHEKVRKISEICRFFLGRALGVDLGSISGAFWGHFGSSWVPEIGKKAIQKPQRKMMEQKVTQAFLTNAEQGGRAALQTSQLYPQGDSHRH